MFSDKSLGYYERLKIFGFKDVSYNTYFTLLQGLRGHSYKLYKPYSRLDIRKFSFSVPVRVINTWNALPYSVLQCNTINTFKRHMDLYLKNTGYL